MKAAALLLLLALATGAAVWGYIARGPGFIKIVLGGDAEEAPRAAWAPPAVSAAVPAAAPITVADLMPWVRDPRWTSGVAAGEAGVALVEQAYHEHFEVAGDPFLFRNRKEEAARLLSAGLADLQALREEFALNPAACRDLDPLLRKYQQALARTPRR